MNALVTLAATAAVGSILAWTSALPPPAIENLPPEIAPLAPGAIDTTTLAAAAARLRQQNPFRLTRKPADVRYNPWEPGIITNAPEPPRIRPPLALTGLVGGPPWNALVEGIPGREGGVLLRVGESASGIRFVALRGDTVLLAGYDTTWSLTARRTWQ